MIRLFTDTNMQTSEFIISMLELGKAKKAVLKNLADHNTYQEAKESEKKKDRCNFLDQIVATRYKTFTKKDLAKYCINHDEPEITALFDKLDENHQQQEWIDSFKGYSERIQEIHMQLVLTELCREGNLPEDRLIECKEEVLKGIYEVFLVTEDHADSIDSLERSLRKSTNIIPK